ncbi:MAG: tetratricopeptide repeat protein [Bacteroidota bacterium]
MGVGDVVEARMGRPESAYTQRRIAHVFYTQESAKFVPALEAKRAANPRSPVFARLASYYLLEGKAQQAADVCLEGLAVFPEYATGRLVLGKAYEALGRHIEAMLEYRKALRAVPDNPAVGELLRRSEQREQEEFKAFSEERAKKLGERRGTIKLETYLEQGNESGQGTVDFLLQRLKAAKINAVPLEESVSSEDKSITGASGTKIVTATLAEIYANQGEYREAILAYRKLREQQPHEAERFDKRIAELQQMERMQHAEQKS